LLVGDYPAPQTYACFVTILGEYARDEGFLTLPDAVRKMTSFPARRLGLPDRGLLQDGYRADVVVFDPHTVGSAVTRANPRQFPTGIEQVIVNGQLVIDKAEHTGALPGRALRFGQAST